MEIQKVDLYGLKISLFTKEELVKSIGEVGQTNKSKIYYGYSLGVLSFIKRYPNYYMITSKFDVMVTDGRGFYFMAHFFGLKLKYDISIPRLTLLALEIANKNSQKLMIVGGTNEINALAGKEVSKKYPEIHLIPGKNGYFTDSQKPNIIHAIVKNNPDLLLLGMPTPKKQQFAAEIKNKITGCVIIPCGGMIDVLAGKEKLTPNWVKKIGFASIYRHAQHPKRFLEILEIYFLTLKVTLICLYKKYISQSNKIDIPSILQKN